MANVETVPIENTILVVRDLRVILAGDLAKIYGVAYSTKPSNAIGRDFQRILRFV
jgi:hypothetical protein